MMNYIPVTSYHRSEVMTAQLIQVVMYAYTVSYKNSLKAVELIDNTNIQFTQCKLNIDTMLDSHSSLLLCVTQVRCNIIVLAATA